MVYDIIQWVYVQDTGRWSEEDPLISVDFDNVSHCNGAYGGAVTRGWLRRWYVVQRSAGSNFLRLGKLQCGRRLFAITGPLQLAPAGRMVER